MFIYLLGTIEYFVSKVVIADNAEESDGRFEISRRIIFFPKELFKEIDLHTRVGDFEHCLKHSGSTECEIDSFFRNLSS